MQYSPIEPVPGKPVRQLLPPDQPHPPVDSYYRNFFRAAVGMLIAEIAALACLLLWAAWR